MLGYFPPVYNNELFYSTIARYHYHSGNASLSQTNKDLFSKTQLKANVEFASRLSVLMTKLNLFNFMSLNEIIEKHTLFPYLSFFVDTELRDELKQMLIKGENLNKLYLKLGLQGHKVSTHSFLKYCKKCLEEDFENLGEGYWHLDHQLPSSYVCILHEEVLLDSSVPFRPKSKTEYVPLTSENCESKEDPSPEIIKNNYSLFKSLTKKGLELFTSRPTFDYKKIHQIYRYILRLKGYLTANGAVKQIELGEDLEEFYGRDFLNYINCSVRLGDNSCWLRLITSKHRSVFHPIYHLLLLNFLNVSVERLSEIDDFEYKPFGKGPYPCLNPAAEHYKELIIEDVIIKRDQNTGNLRGLFGCKCGYQYVRIGPDKSESDVYKYNKIFEYGPIWKERLFYLVKNQKKTYKEVAEELHVSDQTVSRYVNGFKKKPKKTSATLEKLDIFKERWLTLMNENPSYSQDQIRSKDQGLYSLLYKYDKEWLKRNSPEYLPFSKGNNRVDWKQRDQKYISEIRNIVEKIKNSFDKPERITINKIEMETGLNFIRQNINKLPQTKEYLNANLESKIDFQIRKAKWAIKQLETNQEEVTLPRVIQMLNLYGWVTQEVLDEINELIYLRRNTQDVF